MALKIFNLPEQGESIVDATIVRVLCKVGQSVARGDILFEVDSEKAILEVQCAFDGVIRNILVAEGDSVEVGHGLVEIDGKD